MELVVKTNIPTRIGNFQRLSTKTMGFLIKKTTDQGGRDLQHALREEANRTFNVRKKNFVKSMWRIQVAKVEATTGRITQNTTVTSNPKLNKILNLQIAGGYKVAEGGKKLYIPADDSKWGTRIRRNKTDYVSEDGRRIYPSSRSAARSGSRSAKAFLREQAKIDAKYDIDKPIREIQQTMEKRAEFFARVEISGWASRLPAGRLV